MRVVCVTQEAPRWGPFFLCEQPDLYVTAEYMDTHIQFDIARARI